VLQRNSRIIVIALAVGILFWRMPLAFIRPQFWGEDAYLFLDNYQRGLHTVIEPVVGYLIVTSRLIAWMAGFFPIWLAPWIYNYSAVALTLLVVALIMSPRLELPYKPLLALAVVVVPAGWEVLLTLCNSQWILPIGVLVVVFMRPSKSRVTQMLELIFVAATGLTGPFSMFFAPITIALYWHNRQTRTLTFAIIMTVCGLIQAGLMLVAPEPYAWNAMPTVAYDWSIWITTPLRFMETLMPIHRIFSGFNEIVILCLSLPLIAWLVLREPNRWFKLSMTSLALMVLYAGMLKYRGDLNTMIYSNQRYIFAGSIFFIWTLCLNAATFKPILRYSLVTLVIVAEINSFARGRNSEKIITDRHWSQWAEKIEQGYPVVVPIDPTWAMKINSTQDKVITNFSPN
jgi:hypothetical protein